jgi:hypothetical protein
MAAVHGYESWSSVTTGTRLGQQGQQQHPDAVVGSAVVLQYHGTAAGSIFLFAPAILPVIDMYLLLVLQEPSFQ